MTVNGNFVAVPRLDRSEKSLTSQPADRHITRPALGTRCRTPFRDLRALPFGVSQSIEVDSGKAARKNIIASICIPVRDEQTMLDAFVRLVDRLPFPFTGTIEDQWHMAVVFRSFRGCSRQGRID